MLFPITWEFTQRKGEKNTQQTTDIPSMQKQKNLSFTYDK